MKQGQGASIDGTTNIVKHYDDPLIRRNVQSMLAKMAADGASIMRTMVWFRHAEDSSMLNRPTDPLGLAVATNGVLPKQEIDNLISLAADAQASGYKQFIVVAGPQGASNPKCRQGGTWGACYKKDFLSLSWSVIDQIASALHARQLSKISVITDISPENCAVPNSKMIVYDNMATYTRYMLVHYRDSFGDHRFIASCGTGAENVIVPALKSQEALYQQLGIRPDSIDVHVYEKDPQVTQRFLITANAVASQLGVPLDILETYYDHPDVFQIVATLKSTNRLPALRTLLVWPRKATSACEIDVPAPYNIASIDTRLGRRAPDGKLLPRC